MISFLVLFGNFYIKAYINDHKNRKKEKLLQMENNNLQEAKNKNQYVHQNGKKVD